jgi:signal transduction histidine kinase
LEVERGPAGGLRGRPVPLGALVFAVFAIAVLDVLVPAGIVVGMLLALPIVLASSRRSPREIWLVAALAGAAFTAAALLGRAPVAPPLFWVTNRGLVVLSIPAAAAMALVLQRRTLAAERDRDAAARSGDLNRVLMSLLAHDLRAPLVVASQCISYVEDGLAQGRVPDPALLADTAARLERSLRAIEIVLSVARGEIEAPAAGHGTRKVRLGDEIRAEVDSFAREAALRRKRLALALDGVSAQECELNPLVLRQSVAILVDNAIRYAVPGAITVSAQLGRGTLRVSVRDEGPEGAASADGSPPRGAGLGLALSRALLRHAGGSLEQDVDAPGTCWTISLPARACP